MPVVSISGPSGSGKSTLVQALVQRLPHARAIYFDDYKETTQFPASLEDWIRNGCKPNEVSTPRMVEDLRQLCLEASRVNGWVIVEEPFGRARDASADCMDYVISIDIPLEIAFARTIKRAALAVPPHVEAADLLSSIIDFVDQYIAVGRESYAIVNAYVRQNCDLIVDGTKEIHRLADEIIDKLNQWAAGGPAVKVRKATESDVWKVVQLSELWASEKITYGLGPNTVEHLISCIGDYFWVAESNSEVVGYIMGSLHESDGLAVIGAGERYLEIDEVYVHPAHRKAQIGHEMVDALLHQTELQGITRAIVYSASQQWSEIVGFYEKHGFNMWFVQMYR